ncbi:MAG TPA: FHA domain-containing protein [Streptosporangiaceae bacterium]
MAVCPNGHDSASEDFCDICGMRITGTPGSTRSPGATGSHPYGSPGAGTGPMPGSPATTGSSPAMGMPGTGPVPPPAIVGEPCPRCGTARSGQFCEACGYDFNAPQPPRPSGPPMPQPPSPLPPQRPMPPPPSPPPPSPQLPPPSPWPSSSSQPLPSAPSAPSARSVPSAPSVRSAPSVPSVPTAPPVGSAPSVPPTRAVPGSSYAPAVWTVVVSSDRDYYERVRVASGPDWAEVPFPAYAAERRFRLTGNQMRIGRRSVSRGLDPEIDLTGPPADPGISRLHAALIATPDGSWAVLDPGSANGTLVNGNEIPTGNQVPLHDGDRINLGAWTAITVHRG